MAAMLRGSSAIVTAMAKATATEILAILDACARSFTFPMLDNGYVYLAATRLAAYADANDWALTIEVFGYSPREGAPATTIYTFGSRLRGRKTAADFVNADALANYLTSHPNDEFAQVCPVDDAWCDPEGEGVSADATHVAVRGVRVALPSVDEYAHYDIELINRDQIEVYEVCRWLAATQREHIVATEAERRAHVPAELPQILLLDEWNHPDVCNKDCLPSTSPTFVSIANALVAADGNRYQATLPPNTHWRNWPDGGSL